MTTWRAEPSGCIDLTSLNDDDTPEVIDALCEQAIDGGRRRGLHLRRRSSRQARARRGVRVATVVNFPAGRRTPSAAARETSAAIDDGADEVDVVLPYERYAAGDRDGALEVVDATRAGRRRERP